MTWYNKYLNKWFKDGHSIQCVIFQQNFYNSTFTTLGANSAAAILITFSYFLQKIGFEISCKLSLKETICMKCQSLFSEC